MTDIPPIDDLENLSATGAMLEGVLRQWVQEITECAPPDIVTFSEAVDLFGRLTAIRKTLIKLSRLTPPRPNNPSPKKHSHTTDLPPINLPKPNIAQIPCVPDVPYDQLRPQLDAIAAALEIVRPTPPPAPSQDDCELPIPDCALPQSDPSAPSTLQDPSSPHNSHHSHTSHTSHASHASHASNASNSEIRNPLPRRFG